MRIECHLCGFTIEAMMSEESLKNLLTAICNNGWGIIDRIIYCPECNKKRI